MFCDFGIRMEIVSFVWGISCIVILNGVPFHQKCGVFFYSRILNFIGIQSLYHSFPAFLDNIGGRNGYCIHRIKIILIGGLFGKWFVPVVFQSRKSGYFTGKLFCLKSFKVKGTGFCGVHLPVEIVLGKFEVLFQGLFS